MKILVQNPPGGKWTPIGKIIYENEADLQDLLVKDVNTLPFEEIGYDSPFITIGKEITLQNGSLDILAVSPEGQIALIETKLNKNPEAKRTVVGQVLGYASYLWNKSYQDIEDCFNKLKTTEKIDFNGSLADYVRESTADANFSETDFKEGIEKRLRLGTFTLLIVVDEVNEELQNIANYLNERTGQGIDFYLVSMELMADKDRKLLMPRLINPPHKNTAVSGSRASDNYDRPPPTTEEEFLQKLSSEGKLLAEALLKEFKNNTQTILTWGRNGFSVKKQIPKNLLWNENVNYQPYFSFFFFYTKDDAKGNIEEIQFGYPEQSFEIFKGIRPATQDFVNFYRSLKGYDKTREGIKNLTIFDEDMTSRFVALIKNTINKLKESEVK